VTNYEYLRTGQISMVIKKRKGYSDKDSTGYVTDTTLSTYDRSGLLSSWCEKRECIQRLYNSQKQLIVKRNALYGYIRGDYTYAYDDKGRLVQRRFLEAQSGIVLFTDTIQYAFVNTENTILSQKHYIRLSGKEWVLFDEMLLDAVHQNVLKYSLFHHTMRGGRGIHAPGELVYTYDNDGKLLSKHRDDKSGMEEKIYSRHTASDTLRSYKIVQEKKAIQKTLWSETIIVYDSNGLIASVKTTDYKIEKQKGKSSSIVSMIREEEYHWN
jgi:hypothetical protein